MKVLFDFQGLVQKHSGGSKMYFELMKHFPPEVTYEVGLRECDNVHLQRLKLLDIPVVHDDMKDFCYGLNFPKKESLYRLYSKLFPGQTTWGRNRQYSIDLLKKQDFDIFHPTFLDDYFLPYLGKKPFVFHIHDMTTTVLTQYFSSSNDYQTEKKKILASKAAHIIAVSENTKKDVMAFLGIPEEKITVIYHGADDWDYTYQNKSLDYPYFLYVGGRQNYKYFEGMVTAMRDFFVHHDHIKLVVVGSAFTKEENEFIAKYGLTKNVVHQYANDNELFNLYHHALGFIYPSLYEGFGIPILEAYKTECPVLLNDKSCFPEIAGEAAVYFNLDDTGSTLEDALERVLAMSDDERAHLIARQKDRLRNYSWDKAALQLTEVYNKILNK